MERVHSFPPMVGANPLILILGSMPGVVSLQAQQYYAHPQNAFWPIMGAVYGAGLDKTYAERVKLLQERGVALWDVLDHCVRPGSLDSDIKDAVANDFKGFFQRHAGIKLVVLNGGTVAKLFKKYAAGDVPAGVMVRQAPSTSPAYAAMKRAEKIRAWEQILQI